MTDIVCAEMNYIRKSDLSDDEIREHKNRLTIRSRFEGRKVEVYNEGRDFLGVPRHYNVRLGAGNINYINKTSEGFPVEINFNGSLRAHQKTAYATFIREIKSGSVLLNAETGSGKTVMAISFMAHIGRSCLICVPKSDLMEQWQRELVKFTNLTESDIGFAYQNVCDKDKPVVIGMVHSLCKDKYDEEFRNNFGLVIIDECHKLGATEFSKAISKYPAKYRIGLSASMDRKDGTSTVFYLHLGRNIIKTGQTQPKPDVYIFKYAGFSGMIPKYLKQKNQRRGTLLSMLADNSDRNKTLAILAKRLADSGRQTIVISERKVMLGRIRTFLLEAGYSDWEVGVYIYETPKKERRRIALECKIILATSKMLSEGTDIDTVRAIVFGTPMADVLQPVGRIRRVKEGLKTPIVLDFTDIRYKETIRWFRGRERWYNQQGFKTHYM